MLLSALLALAPAFSPVLPLDPPCAQKPAAAVRHDDPARSADDKQTEARPAFPLDHRLLRAVFLDLLGRPPFRAEYDAWLGRGLRELIDETVGSEAYWRQWLEEQLYYFMLLDNFRPASKRVLAIPSSLAEERIHVRDATHRILLSPSFELRNPGGDTFVTVVMEQVTGLKVQKKARDLDIGKKIYDGGKGIFLGAIGNSQSDIVRIAIEDKLFTRTYLAREYERMMRLPPQKRELATWVARIESDWYANDEIVAEWLLSDAYQERLANPSISTNRQFIRTLFVDLLDRMPSPEEVEPLRSALDGLSDSAPLRSILVRLLLDSGTVPVPEKSAIDDPAAWISDLFVRLMGRPASPEELEAFVEAFADPVCKTTTVVYAILSHPEYHLN